MESTHTFIVNGKHLIHFIVQPWLTFGCVSLPCVQLHGFVNAFPGGMVKIEYMCTMHHWQCPYGVGGDGHKMSKEDNSLIINCGKAQSLLFKKAYCTIQKISSAKKI